MLQSFLTIIYVIACFILVMVVLLQAGKGAGMGAAFGGTTQAVFGGRGAAPILAKITTGAAILFLLLAMVLSYMSSRQKSVVKGAEEETPPEQASAVEVKTPDAGAQQAEGQAALKTDGGAGGQAVQPVVETPQVAPVPAAKDGGK